MRLFLNCESRENWESILDSCVEKYNYDLLEEKKIEFKSKARSFVKNYQFLVQVKSFKNSNWESLNSFLKLLVNKLPQLDNSDLSAGIINSVDIESYRVELLASQSINLSGENTLSPIAKNIVSGNSQSRSENGGTITKVAHTFGIGRASIYRWLSRPKLSATKVKSRQRKLD